MIPNTFIISNNLTRARGETAAKLNSFKVKASREMMRMSLADREKDRLEKTKENDEAIWLLMKEIPTEPQQMKILDRITGIEENCRHQADYRNDKRLYWLKQENRKSKNKRRKLQLFNKKKQQTPQHWKKLRNIEGS